MQFITDIYIAESTWRTCLFTLMLAVQLPIFALIESVGTTANSFALTILCTHVEKRVTLFADLFN